MPAPRHLHMERRQGYSGFTSRPASTSTAVESGQKVHTSLRRRPTSTPAAASKCASKASANLWRAQPWLAESVSESLAELISGSLSCRAAGLRRAGDAALASGAGWAAAALLSDAPPGCGRWAATLPLDLGLPDMATKLGTCRRSSLPRRAVRGSFTASQRLIGRDSGVLPAREARVPERE